MRREDFLRIAEKYENETASSEEKKLVEAFFSNAQNKNISDQWSFAEEEKIKLRLLGGVLESITQEELKPAIHIARKGNLRWYAAASIALLCCLSFGAYFYGSSFNNITYTSNKTLKGETSKIFLSDGSIVHLNADSRLTYPTSFESQSTREIELIGQAFFEVKRNEQKPFIISSGNIVTQVLGTSFDISAYKDDNLISVNVKTGKVRVSNAGKEEVLLPNERAVYDRTKNTLSKSAMQFSDDVVWLDGDILLQGSLINAMQKIERVFNVEVVMDEKAFRECRIIGRFKNQSLENVLESMAFTLGFEFEITTGSQVILKGEGCK